MQRGARNLLKAGLEPIAEMSLEKKGSSKPNFVGALQSGLNRRAFLRQSSVAVLFASIAACKPNVANTASTDSNTPKSKKNKTINLTDTYNFDGHQKESIAMVQQIIFPDDGDGPSAKDINALAYLEWTLTDPDNDADGDGEFIAKGVGWLDSLSEQTQGDQFIKLKPEQQNKVLTQISQSSAGENWMSILIYYLMEALLFDPLYGGNPKGVGWTWLNHQPGFPAPDEETNYRNFL